MIVSLEYYPRVGFRYVGRERVRTAVGVTEVIVTDRDRASCFARCVAQVSKVLCHGQ